MFSFFLLKWFLYCLGLSFIFLMIIIILILNLWLILWFLNWLLSQKNKLFFSCCEGFICFSLKRNDLFQFMCFINLWSASRCRQCCSERWRFRTSSLELHTVPPSDPQELFDASESCVGRESEAGCPGGGPVSHWVPAPDHSWTGSRKWHQRLRGPADWYQD